MKKIISNEHFDILINSGQVVPRNEKTGEPIPFKVGKEYTIANKAGQTARAHCTQDCPYNLALLK